MKIKPVCLSAFLLILFQGAVFSQSDTNNISHTPAGDSSAQAFNNENSGHDLRAGERLFHGFMSTTQTTVNCASCHNVKAVDTLNWNPSAAELGLKYQKLGFEAFKAALTQPTGQVMMRLHENLRFTDEQLFQINSYLSHLAVKGEEPLKPLRTNRIIFTLLVIVFLVAFVDLAITRKIRYRVIHLAVLTISLLLITRYVVHSAIDLGRSPDYQPSQPIKFSHLVHAGQNQTDCLYCHFNAENSKYAGIPPANICTNCHVLVKEGTRSGKFEIAKIYHALETGKPIEWVKVHNVPDHVYFNHAQHVVAGKIDCTVCHGDVASMHEIVQVKDLSMGWCVNCHRETKVQFDNAFYGKYEQLHRDIREGKISNVTVEQIGGIDCMKCHY